MFLSKEEWLNKNFSKDDPYFKLGERAYVVSQGERLTVDECTIDFLYTYHDGLYENLMNDSSLVFRIVTPNKSVLFLGDLGPAGGDVLFEESRHLLKSDLRVCFKNRRI